MAADSAWIREVQAEANLLQEQREQAASDYRRALYSTLHSIPALAVLHFLANLNFIRCELGYTGSAPWTEDEVLGVDGIV